MSDRARVRADLDFITPELAVGGDIRHPSEVADVLGLGITHIIDVRAEWADAHRYVTGWPEPPALDGYLWLPSDDDGKHRPARWFRQGAAYARAAWDADPQAKILVHCAAGINRGPSMAFGILLDQGYRPDQAWDAIRAVRGYARIAYAEDAVAAIQPESGDWRSPVLRIPDPLAWLDDAG